MAVKTWLDKHKETLTPGQRIADAVATGMGSWKFIIWQTIFVIIWMILNVIGFIRHWDAYPFILLNLIFSTQAAYAAPIIMMAQNRLSLYAVSFALSVLRHHNDWCCVSSLC